MTSTIGAQNQLTQELISVQNKYLPRKYFYLLDIFTQTKFWCCSPVTASMATLCFLDQSSLVNAIGGYVKNCRKSFLLSKLLCYIFSVLGGPGLLTSKRLARLEKWIWKTLAQLSITTTVPLLFDRCMGLVWWASHYFSSRRMNNSKLQHYIWESTIMVGTLQYIGLNP